MNNLDVLVVSVWFVLVLTSVALLTPENEDHYEVDGRMIFRFVLNVVVSGIVCAIPLGALRMILS